MTSEEDPMKYTRVSSKPECFCLSGAGPVSTSKFVCLCVCVCVCVYVCIYIYIYIYIYICTYCLFLSFMTQDHMCVACSAVQDGLLLEEPTAALNVSTFPGPINTHSV